MSVFRGTEDSTGQVIWQPDNDDDISNCGDTAMSSKGKYCFLFDSTTNWLNCDRFAEFPGAPTDVEVVLPAGYSYLNSKVFLSINGKNTVISIYDRFTGFKVSRATGVKIGLNLTFVVWAVKVKVLYYGVRSTTIQQNHREVFTELKPTTESELKAILKQLK